MKYTRKVPARIATNRSTVGVPRTGNKPPQPGGSMDKNLTLRFLQQHMPGTSYQGVKGLTARASLRTRNALYFSRQSEQMPYMYRL